MIDSGAGPGNRTLAPPPRSRGLNQADTAPTVQRHLSMAKTIGATFNR